MIDKEKDWDKILQIKTEGRDDTKSDHYRFSYEPTPYIVLERLAESGLISEQDSVVDYGCGKGRVGFFLSHRTKSRTMGVDFYDRVYRIAMENKKTAVSRAKVDFELIKAEEYKVPKEVNRCYFFNPFSVEILRKVMARIVESYYDSPREIFLFFYYPSNEYISYLMTVDELDFYDEIECEDLFEGNNPRERIMIFQFPHLETDDEK